MLPLNLDRFLVSHILIVLSSFQVCLPFQAEDKGWWCHIRPCIGFIFLLPVGSMLGFAKESTRKKLQDWRRKKGLAPSCLLLFGFLSASCSCEQHFSNTSLPSWSSNWILLVISPTLAEPAFLCPSKGCQHEPVACPPTPRGLGPSHQGILQASKF